MECRGTCHRLAGGALWIFALAALVSWAPAQEGAEPAQPAANSSTGGASATDELTLDQSRVSDRYARLEELMFKMASLEDATNPKRAALLRRAIAQSKERLTKTELEAVVKLLSQKQLKRALDGQVAVQGDLKALLELLQSEDRADRLKSEQERIKEYIKEVDRLIRLQKSLQGQTEGGLDAKKLAKDQGDLATRTGDLAQKIKENEEGKAGEEEQEEGDDSQQDGQKSDGEKSEGQKSEGQKSEGQKSEGQKGDGQKSDGQKSDGQKNEGQENKGEKEGQKNEGQKNGEKNEGQKSDGQKGEGQQSEGQQSEGQQSEGQKSEGQKSEGQKSEGQQSEGQQNQGQQNQGQQQNQQQQDQQQQDNPARKRIEQAEQKMRDAQKRLEEARRNESVEEQRQAREELEKAKAELEEILRQMRQEEVARTLADLEARFRRMLEMQLRVYESTRRLDQRPETDRGETFIVQAGKLSSDERAIANEAQRALSLLIEEGSSVAFPATVEQMHEDMLAVVNRLAEVKVDDITIGYEEDVIAALEELIQALQKAQQDLEQQQQQQQQQQQDQDQPLVDELAELKMIKSLQERVNKRTVRFARLLEDDQDLVGQAEAADLVDALQKLSERQQEIFRITRDLVLGKNQ
ncbi:MAG TPA: hypothetical protein VMP01_22290 [Pirellulaceae bacterium]|nr:hypothetical protein [Pirellulaceae bacterium]